MVVSLFRVVVGAYSVANQARQAKSTVTENGAIYGSNKAGFAAACVINEEFIV